jgi:transposase InsO family protein
MTLVLIDEAVASGARLARACDVIGLSARTVERWRTETDGGRDRRAGPHHAPAHQLSDAEKTKVLAVANSPEFRDKSPKQIVPTLADRGEYVASESSFYRVLRENDQLAHRGRARRPSASRPKELVASVPNQVWCWDITFMRAAVRGTFYFLYLVVDVFSRKIVGWSVEAEESQDLAVDMIDRAIREHDVPENTLVLHADNGGPMKGSTMLATLQRLGIVPSFSRPSVSDDNAFSEALFRTMKYRPSYPRKPFTSLEEARRWVADFVAWYNGEHLHSAIRYVTPDDRHAGRDAAILAARRAVYRAAKGRTPRRWTGDIRDWSPVGPVHLNRRLPDLGRKETLH